MSVAATCLVFPAIISRMESYLIAQEGCKMLDLGDIKLEYALEAFTKDSDNTEEHRSLQIHVQRGMGKNYERLELLGDSLLKIPTMMNTTITLTECVSSATKTCSKMQLN
jgi:endoribonuclease Dicer